MIWVLKCVSWSKHLSFTPGTPLSKSPFLLSSSVVCSMVNWPGQNFRPRWCSYSFLVSTYLQVLLFLTFGFCEIVHYSNGSYSFPISVNSLSSFHQQHPSLNFKNRFIHCEVFLLIHVLLELLILGLFFLRHLAQEGTLCFQNLFPWGVEDVVSFICEEMYLSCWATFILFTKKYLLFWYYV